MRATDRPEEPRDDRDERRHRREHGNAVGSLCADKNGYLEWMFCQALVDRFLGAYGLAQTAWTATYAALAAPGPGGTTVPLRRLLRLSTPAQLRPLPTPFSRRAPR
ncbi:hypothetical protein [Streptomyces sp. NPDC126499]|uniref:hypothetical protein n=1 Tax=Streptomyces sp. NPDC126499 TaxID=3155314 RepID=UPI003330EE08